MLKISTGITIRITSASLAFIVNAIINAPMNMPGDRRAIRSAIISTFCTCWMSLVSRVTREPVLNSSMFAKENCCTFLNTSLRRSLVKQMAAFDEK